MRHIGHLIRKFIFPLSVGGFADGIGGGGTGSLAMSVKSFGALLYL